MWHRPRPGPAGAIVGPTFITEDGLEGSSRSVQLPRLLLVFQQSAAPLCALRLDPVTCRWSRVSHPAEIRSDPPVLGHPEALGAAGHPLRRNSTLIGAPEML